MTYHPHDDLPDDPPSLPGHDLTVSGTPGTRLEPGDVYASCSCGYWDFTSVESIGGGVEDPLPYWEDHLTAVELGEVAA